MKKGFTMIELIFVIVILGVLASVAIPRLAATRDDAEVAKAATNLTTAVSDLTAYYTAKGHFKSGSGTQAKTIADFTKLTNALSKEGKLLVKGKKECVGVTLPDGTNTSGKVVLTLNFKPTEDPVCQQLVKLPGIKTMCGKGETSSLTGDCKIQIGGSGGIQF